jgi:hypothetical protein
VDVLTCRLALAAAYAGLVGFDWLLRRVLRAEEPERPVVRP